MHILCNNDNTIIKINTDEILFFESQENIIIAATAKSNYNVENTLFELELLLSNYGFIRISKWCILNIMMITDFRRKRNSQIKVILSNEKIVYVNRTYLKKFLFYIKRGDI